MWTVAIFASRESPEILQRAIDAAGEAAGGAAIDVIVNGNDALAGKVKAGRLIAIKAGDKANAWNQYVKIWNGAQCAFFVDGYAAVRVDALRLIWEAIVRTGALAGTGVPTSGRSAPKLRRQMVSVGGIHGNLYAIRGDVLEAMRESGFRLPVGLYRTDPLIGAVCAFNLNPKIYSWDITRIAVQHDATWEVLSPATLAQTVRRKMRQAQGVLENLAIHEHLAIERRMPSELPSDVQELVLGWIHAHPKKAKRVFLRNPLCYLAARKLTEQRRWSDLEPYLVSAIS